MYYKSELPDLIFYSIFSQKITYGQAESFSELRDTVF